MNTILTHGILRSNELLAHLQLKANGDLAESAILESKYQFDITILPKRVLVRVQWTLLTLPLTLSEMLR